MLTTGDKIRLYREMRGMTQVQLAAITGINVGTIRKYELGIRNPKPDQLIKIADGVGKNVSTFYDLNICTAGDIMTLLIAISEKAEVAFIGDQDGNGHYKANEVAIRFKDPYMQELLTDWAIMSHDFNQQLEKLSSEPDDAKRAEKLRLMSPLYNSYMGILTDKGRVSVGNEPIETPSNKGLKDCMPFEKSIHFKRDAVVEPPIEDSVSD